MSLKRYNILKSQIDIKKNDVKNIDECKTSVSPITGEEYDESIGIDYDGKIDRSVPLIKPNNLLTDKQQKFYEKNGYLVIPGLVTNDEMDVWKKQFDVLCNEPSKRPYTMTVMKDISQKHIKNKTGQRLVTKIQDFHDDPVLFTYCKLPSIIKYVQCFTGNHVKSIHTMLIHKPPNIGKSGRHPFHQDLHYFPLRSANNIVCSWTALEDVNQENGCLSVLPGTHNTCGLLRHGYPKTFDGKVNKAYHGILELGDDLEKEISKRVHLEMKKGDTVFFHPLLLHASGANRTQGYRKAISCHYSGIDNTHYVNVKGTVQEELADEIEEMSKRKLGTRLKFNDVWRWKSRKIV